MGLNQIHPLVKGISTSEIQDRVGLQDKKENGTVFASMYQSAIQMLDSTNALQKQAEKAAVSFAVGEIDNIHEVMIAQEKATVALQYTVQIRDKVLEAYNEIMRMQI